ncbi:Exocyst complex component 7 [Hordeum vulgare]|nr:Exocyst complex component 7 [Hordeum vulgare]
MDLPGDEDDEDDDDYVAEGGGAPSFAPSHVEPSWDKKLKEKIKKLFGLQAPRQYTAHVAEREARSRHKETLKIGITPFGVDLNDIGIYKVGFE